MTSSLLIVEDDAALREQLQRRLASRGYRIEVAASIAAALALLETLPQLDAALLDQNLDQASGLDLIAPILARFPDCRVIMHTGYGSIPAAVAATRRGASDYLTKPATLSQLISALSGNSDHAHTPTPLPDAPPSLERLEWEHIQRTLDQHDGNISAAARTLGIHRRTLQRRLKKRPSAHNFHRDRGTGDTES